MRTKQTVKLISLWMIILMVFMSVQIGIAAPKTEKSQFMEKMTIAEQKIEKAGLTLPQSISGMKARIQQLEEGKLEGNRNRIQVIRLGKTMDAYTSETIAQEWQDGAWVNAWKMILTYDDQGTQVLSWVDQVWQDGAWVNSGRMTAQADANGNIIERRSENWDNGAWVTSYLTTYQYDANGNETQSIIQMATDEGSALENISKTEFVYNDSGDLAQETQYTWTSGAWSQSSVTNYIYNAQHQLIEETTQMEFFGFFISSKTNYTYNASGYVETVVEQSLDMFTQIWANESKTLYEYNANGDNTVWTDQTWDGSQWVNEDKETFTYAGPNGSITEDLYQTWDGSTWVNIEHWQYTYDANGNETQYLYQVWDSGAWVNEDRTQYTYDANGNNTQTLDQVWENGAWVNESLSTGTYDSEGVLIQEVYQVWQDGAWVNDTRYLYTYSGGSDVSEEGQNLPENFTIQNYPNPFNPQTTIQFNLPAQDRLSLQILDIRGRVVRTLASDRSFGQGTHQITWNGKDDDQISVPSGVYFYRFTGEMFKASGRCLLMK